MKLKKVLLLVFMLFLLSGCKMKYEVEIYNNKVTEKTYINYSKQELNGQDPYDMTLNLIAETGDNGDFLISDYRKNINNNTGVMLVNKYKNINNFKMNTAFFGACYVANNFTDLNDYITIKTSNKFSCLDEIEGLENIDIVIKTNHKVKENNADEKKGSSYIWHITKENSDNKPIIIQMYKKKYVFNYNNEIFKKIGLIILVVGGTLLVIYIVYNWFKYRDIKSNNI